MSQNPHDGGYFTNLLNSNAQQYGGSSNPSTPSSTNSNPSPQEIMLNQQYQFQQGFASYPNRFPSPQFFNPLQSPQFFNPSQSPQLPQMESQPTGSQFKVPKAREPAKGRGKKSKAKKTAVDLDRDDDEDVEVIAQVNRRKWTKSEEMLLAQCWIEISQDKDMGNDRPEEHFWNDCQIFRTRAVRNMMNGVYAKIGTKVDINKIAFDTDLDLVTSMLWGCSEAGEGDDSIFSGGGFREVEYKIVELLGAPNISDYLPLLSCFDLQGRQREMQRQLEYVDRNFNNIIKERIKVNSRNIERGDKKDETKDFLQILLDIKDQKDTATSLNPDTATSFNIIHIKALLLDMVTAATDASSTMVEWVMAEIMHNPRVKKKIQDELTMVIGKNVVEESHLPKLSYLDAVIKETFRLHPPLPLLIQRCPDETCKVGGYTIPKGTIVSMNIWAIHRDPKNWSNPLEFKPERFLNGKWDYYGNNMKYVSFGSGRRICPGIALGEKMLMYIVASLLHSFDWRLPEDEVSDLSEEFGFVTKKKNSLMVIPSQRFDDDSLYI